MDKKTVDNRVKPEVNLEELDQAKLEEEYRAQQVIDEIDKDTPKDEEEEPGEPEPGGEPKGEEPPKKPDTDWENKFKESQKEALVLSEQLKKIEEEKNKKIEITEDYLVNKFPDWDTLSDGEKKALKRAEELGQEIQEIKNKTNQFNNDRQWQEKVDGFITNELPDAFPQIVGREEAFKRFATRPSRKGLSMDDLGKIFLYENPPAEPNKKKNLFHAPGSIPPKPIVAPGTVSADQAADLMKTRPSEYLRLVRAGKLKVKI